MHPVERNLAIARVTPASFASFREKQNTRKKKHGEKQINMMTRFKGIEEGNREAMRQT